MTCFLHKILIHIQSNTSKKCNKSGAFFLFHTLQIKTQTQVYNDKRNLGMSRP